ncbi:MAG: hypothetical protein Q9181_007135 [Wetmoreana brouardii]
MALLSYTVALAVTRDSDAENRQRLPSPYQLELLISTLNGSLLAFWSVAICRGASPLEGDIIVQYDGYARSSYQYANKSAANRIVSQREGWLIVPSKLPAEIDLVATTIGSSTSCKVVTQLCDRFSPISTRNVSDIGMNGTEMGASETYNDPREDVYECKPDTAGLNLKGNFSEMGKNSRYPPLGYDFVLVDYTDATRSTVADDVELRGPTVWYAVLMQVPTDFVTNMTLLENITEHTPGLLGSMLSYNIVNSILACTTELSDVSYSLTNGSYTTNAWTAMNNTASYAFVSAMRLAVGSQPQLQQGMQTSIAAANKLEDIALGWASTYDQTILSQGIGMLLGRPPLSITQSSTTQVTRIPRAPLVTLIVLDLIYATIGTCLLVAALIAVRKGHGVRDAQARLSTLAVVAESFESPAWGDDARDVNMLFAERRGESTRRIALVRQAGGGGRRYKQIVAPGSYARKTATEGV